MGGDSSIRGCWGCGAAGLEVVGLDLDIGRGGGQEPENAGEAQVVVYIHSPGNLI